MGSAWGRISFVIGGALVALAIVIALPMSFFVLGAIFSAIIGWLLNDTGETATGP